MSEHTKEKIDPYQLIMNEGDRDLLGRLLPEVTPEMKKALRERMIDKGLNPDAPLKPLHQTLRREGRNSGSFPTFSYDGMSIITSNQERVDVTRENWQEAWSNGWSQFLRQLDYEILMDQRGNPAMNMAFSENEDGTREWIVGQGVLNRLVERLGDLPSLREKIRVREIEVRAEWPKYSFPRFSINGHEFTRYPIPTHRPLNWLDAWHGMMAELTRVKTARAAAEKILGEEVRDWY